jgi:hypothetical protein
MAAEVVVTALVGTAGAPAAPAPAAAGEAAARAEVAEMAAEVAVVRTTAEAAATAEVAATAEEEAEAAVVAAAVAAVADLRDADRRDLRERSSYTTSAALVEISAGWNVGSATLAQAATVAGAAFTGSRASSRTATSLPHAHTAVTAAAMVASWARFVTSRLSLLFSAT